MITFIGPCYPWRGGVAHHTNNLINSIVDSGEEIKMFTFSKQYPSFLYPGENQKEPHETKNPLKIKTCNILNPVNPFTWLLTAYKIIREKPAHCLVQYWHPFFVPCFTVIFCLLRVRGIKVICIIQTLIPHDRHYGDSWLIHILFSQIDGAIFDKSMYQQFKVFSPHFPFKIIQLPVFNQFGEPVSTITARKYLGLPQDRKILLFFGFIRKYKGLDILLEALPYVIRHYPNVHLEIVGDCFGDYDFYQDIIFKNNLTSYVTSNIRYVPNEDIRYWFGASDLLVMPYRHLINSGVENIGKIYAKKSLLSLSSDPKNLAQKIITAIKKAPDKPKNLFGWQEYTKELNSFLNSI